MKFPHPTGPPEALRPKAFLGDVAQPATLAALSAAPATMQVDGKGQAFIVGVFCWEQNAYGTHVSRQKKNTHKKVSCVLEVSLCLTASRDWFFL